MGNQIDDEDFDSSSSLEIESDVEQPENSQKTIQISNNKKPKETRGRLTSRQRALYSVQTDQREIEEPSITAVTPSADQQEKLQKRRERRLELIEANKQATIDKLLLNKNSLNTDPKQELTPEKSILHSLPPNTIRMLWRKNGTWLIAENPDTIFSKTQNSGSNSPELCSFCSQIKRYRRAKDSLPVCNSKICYNKKKLI